MEINSEILSLADKRCKAANIIMLKNIKKTNRKKKQIENLNREIKIFLKTIKIIYIKKNVEY